jgi:repressor LexA
MPITLYKRQRQILNFIKQYIQTQGASPTLQQIAEAIGVKSLATVHEHLQALEEKKVIQRYKGTVRGIKVLDDTPSIDHSGITLPILGFIAAGQPLEPHTDPNATVCVNPGLLSNKKAAFALQVKGESMIEEGILDGDYVICEQQETANNGDIVVAMLENGFVTLKKFFKEVNRVRLEPANSRMQPIYAKRVVIQGRVTAIMRRFNHN